MTTPTTIVPAEETPTLTVLNDSVSLGSYVAVQSLRNGKIPAKDIKAHEGKGSKVFRYVSHIKATKTMNDAFDQFWNFETLSHAVYEDKSATSLGRLTIYFYDKLGELIHTRVVTQTGAKEFVNGMSIANVVLSAESRSLLRCMLRAFDYGAELYKDEEDDFTPETAWRMLKEFAEKNKYPYELMVASMKASGIPREDLADKFEQAYSLIMRLAREYQASEAQRLESEKQHKAIADAEAIAARAMAAADKARAELAN